MSSQGSIGGSEGPKIPSVEQIATSFNKAFEGEDTQGRIYVTSEGFVRMSEGEAQSKWEGTSLTVYSVSAENLQEIAEKFKEGGSKVNMDKIRAFSAKLASSEEPSWAIDRTSKLVPAILDSITPESIKKAREARSVNTNAAKKPKIKKISIHQDSRAESNRIKELFAEVPLKLKRLSDWVKEKVETFKSYFQDRNVTMGFKNDPTRRLSIRKEDQIESEKSDFESAVWDVTYAVENNRKLRVGADGKIFTKQRRTRTGTVGKRKKSQESAQELVKLIQKEVSNKNTMDYDKFSSLDQLVKKLESWDWFQGAQGLNKGIQDSFEQLKNDLSEIKTEVDDTKYISIDAMIEKAINPEKKEFREHFVRSGLNYASANDMLSNIAESMNSAETHEKRELLLQLAQDFVNTLPSNYPDLQIPNSLHSLSIPESVEKNKVEEAKNSFSSKIPTNKKEYQQMVEDFSNDLTAISSQVYQNIRPAEFAGQAWAKNKANAPNIARLTELSTLTTRYVVKRIMDHNNIEDRTLTLKFFIDTAEKLLEKGNYNDAMAIVGAFGNASVNRLQETFSKLPKSHSRKLETLRMALSNTGNFKQLRNLIDQRISNNESFIPFLGIFLTDLTFTDDGNVGQHKKNGGFNIDKLKNLAGVINKIIKGKTEEEATPPQFDLLSELEEMKGDPNEFDRKMYTLSLELQPRKQI